MPFVLSIGMMLLANRKRVRGAPRAEGLARDSFVYEFDIIDNYNGNASNKVPSFLQTQQAKKKS